MAYKFSTLNKNSANANKTHIYTPIPQQINPLYYTKRINT